MSTDPSTDSAHSAANRAAGQAPQQSDLKAAPGPALGSRTLAGLPWKIPLRETVAHNGGEVTSVKRTRSRRVLRMKAAVLGLPGVDPETVVFAKRYANVYWWRRVAWLTGLSKASREARATRRVAERGFRAPEVLGVAANWAASFLVTKEIAGLRSLGGELAETPPGERRRLWAVAGEFTHKVWSAGLFHPDYLQEHICLCDPEGDGAVEGRKIFNGREFVLIDLDGVAFGPPDHAGGVPAVAEKKRYFNAMQVLRSIAPDLGGDEERLAFLENAFSGDWATEKDAILAGVLEEGRRIGAKTHLESLAGR